MHAKCTIPRQKIPRPLPNGGGVWGFFTQPLLKPHLPRCLRRLEPRAFGARPWSPQTKVLDPPVTRGERMLGIPMGPVGPMRIPGNGNSNSNFMGMGWGWEWLVGNGREQFCVSFPFTCSGSFTLIVNSTGMRVLGTSDACWVSEGHHCGCKTNQGSVPRVRCTLNSYIARIKP